jgi:hypothetical protein
MAVFYQDTFRFVGLGNIGDCSRILPQRCTILFISSQVAKAYQRKREFGRPRKFRRQKISQQFSATALDGFRPISSVSLEILHLKRIEGVTNAHGYHPPSPVYLSQFQTN